MKYIQIFTMISIRSFVSSSFVEKKVFSDNTRLVFPAGIEGTGHHYFMSIWDVLDPSIKKPFPFSMYRIDYSMSSNIENYNNVVEESKHNMNVLYDETILDSPKLVYPHKTYSYPSDHGKDKAFQCPDLRPIAEDAEESGIDLRIIYLKRSAKDSIISNTDHRQFHMHLGIEEESEEERFMRYIRILFTSIAVLHSQLLEIDPKFIVCHDFNIINDVDQMGKIANFISPNEEIANDIISINTDDLKKKNQKKPKLEVDFEPIIEKNMLLIDRLQKKLDSIEEMICE